MNLTFTNGRLGTRTRIRLGPKGIISSQQAFLARKALVPIPGSDPDAGHIGENGEQRPPELGGKVRYDIEALPGGGARFIPTKEET